MLTLDWVYLTPDPKEGAKRLARFMQERQPEITEAMTEAEYAERYKVFEEMIGRSWPDPPRETPCD